MCSVCRRFVSLFVPFLGPDLRVCVCWAHSSSSSSDANIGVWWADSHWDDSDVLTNTDWLCVICIMNIMIKDKQSATLMWFLLSWQVFEHFVTNRIVCVCDNNSLVRRCTNKCICIKRRIWCAIIKRLIPRNHNWGQYITIWISDLFGHNGNVNGNRCGSHESSQSSGLRAPRDQSARLYMRACY